MIRIYFLALVLFFSQATFAQLNKAQLEKQRESLKKEIQEAERLLAENKSKSQENFMQWKLITNKVELQEGVINNLNKNLKVLDDDIYILQRDINRYDRLLDTLKREYATSMVYAYKNRGNYDFMNFIFSADNFNDAVKRVAYLKTYRDHRERQGENILRTQELRKRRVAEITGVKNQKKSTIDEQSVALKDLESQQKEKDRIVAELKKRGGEISAKLSNKRNQMNKVQADISAAIKKAIDDARKAAAAKAAEERKRRDAEALIAKRKAEEERKRLEAERIAAAKNATASGNVAANIPKPSAKPIEAPKPAVVNTPKPSAPVNDLLTTDKEVRLNNSFKSYKGSLPWPVDNPYVLMHYGKNKLPSGTDLINPGLTISSPIGSNVKVVFEGKVFRINDIDGTKYVTIQHGVYFTTYGNLSGVTVQVGDAVRSGQVIGKVSQDFNSSEGSIEFLLRDDRSEYNPASWLRAR